MTRRSPGSSPRTRRNDWETRSKRDAACAAFEARDFTPSPEDALAVPDEVVVPGQPRDDVRTRIRRGKRSRTRRLVLAVGLAVLGLIAYGVIIGYVLPEFALATRGDEARAAALEVLARSPDWKRNEPYYVERLDRVHEQAYKRVQRRRRRKWRSRRAAYIDQVLRDMRARLTSIGASTSLVACGLCATNATEPGNPSPAVTLSSHLVPDSRCSVPDRPDLL